MLEVILIALLGVLSVVFLFLNHRYHHWKRKGLPQPSVVFGFGNLLDAVLVRTNAGFIYDKIYRSYPNHSAVGVYGFYTPRLMVRSPELIQRVMASDFSSFHDNEMYVTKRLDPWFANDPFILKGAEWKPARAKLMAAMKSSRMKEIFPVMKEVLPRLNTYIEDNLCKDLETKELATLFMMDNISNVVFGLDSNCFSDPNADFHKMGDIMMKEQMQVWWKTMIMFLMPTVRDIVGYRFVPKSVSDYIENMVKGVVEFRNKYDLNRKDLLQYFMTESSDPNDILFYVATFFLEGFETSSMTASVTLYELAMNPSLQQLVYQEVKDTFGDKAEPDFSDMNNLPYLDKVLQESLRKYPVMFVMAKECTKPITLQIDDKAVDIQVGTPVLVPVYPIHHDPNYYPNPEVFDPERFNEETKAARPQYTYMPFGEGPRICPGIRFGSLQVKLLVTNLVLRYKIHRCENTPEKLTFSKSAFMVTPCEKVWVRLEKRK